MNKSSNRIALLVIAVLVLAAIVGVIYWYRAAPAGSPASATNPSKTKAGPEQSAYDNFGIAFKYPPEWGTPKESFYGAGLGSIGFSSGTSTAQPFDVMIEQDTNPDGAGLLNETFDQMIARFEKNDQYIYDVKMISTDGVNGDELFYKSAVTGLPYHVEAYFPSRNGTYISLGADLESVPQDEFDTIISTLKWDEGSAVKLDASTGNAIYSNNGMTFEYPEKFDTDYASFSIQTSVSAIDSSKLDKNGCYSTVGETGKPSPASLITVNGLKFCYSTSGDVGAGQLYNDYGYTTFRNGSAYTIDYVVHTSNGCGAYQDSADLNSPLNAKYVQCMAFKNNYNGLVLAPIWQSISTFAFASTE